MQSQSIQLKISESSGPDLSDTTVPTKKRLLNWLHNWFGCPTGSAVFMRILPTKDGCMLICKCGRFCVLRNVFQRRTD